MEKSGFCFWKSKTIIQLKLAQFANRFVLSYLAMDISELISRNFSIFNLQLTTYRNTKCSLGPFWWVGKGILSFNVGKVWCMCFFILELWTAMPLLVSCERCLRCVGH